MVLPKIISSRIKIVQLKLRFSEEQIVRMIQEHKEGKSVTEISREYGVAEQTFYKWQQKFGDMKVSEVKKMKSLEEENAKLKRLVAEFSLEKMVMSDVINFASKVVES